MALHHDNIRSISTLFEHSKQKPWAYLLSSAILLFFHSKLIHKNVIIALSFPGRSVIRMSVEASISLLWYILSIDYIFAVN